MQLKINKEYSFSKIGLNEVVGLKSAMHLVAAPLLAFVKDKTYWNDNLELSEAEYVGRDGFIPYSSNCGGLQLSIIVPKCEEYDWCFLHFGECDPDYCSCHTGNNNECELVPDGHMDAKFRIWLKFEGLENGVMSFYLYCGGGNGDAPYFRTKAEATIFESSFEAKTIKQFEIKAKSEIKKLLKKLGAK